MLPVNVGSQCKRSDQPKNRKTSNDARLILRRKLKRGNDTIEFKLKAKLQPWDSCFDFVGSLQHDVASCEVCEHLIL